MAVDWNAMLLGFAVGVPMSALFFAGLAWSVRRALDSARPRALLLLSAAMRIAVLFAGAFWVTAFWQRLWPLAGYALAFFLVRLVAVVWARSPRTPTPTPDRQDY